MKITDIKNPQFLKKMKIKDLKLLSNNIRSFIIENVSKTGGHLSSNLGIVDLTIAIHKVFNSPKDKIIFDVSQKISESDYDSYEAGHSSTSLSAALGMAIARDKLRKDYNVIAVIGDGSIGNGLAYEALNHIGNTKTKLIIILNDNEMSISENVGAMHNMLDKIRVKNGYNNVKEGTKKVLNSIPIIGNKLNIGIKNIKESIKKIYLKDGFIFEELGIKYYGPINGHDYHELLAYLELAKKEDEPVLIHVITKKGYGYKYAMEDKKGIWHGVGPFDIESGEMINKSNLPTWSEVISNNLIRLTSKYNDIMVITPAMMVGSKLSKYKELYPNNFIDAGIAEEHALVLGNGLSLTGVIPFISIYSTFLQRGYDEIIHDIARMNSHVILLIDRCGIVGEDGDTHQGIYDISFLMSIPNIIITTPKDSIEAANLMYTAYENKKPFCIRYSKERIDYEEKEHEIIPIGSWEEIVKGKEAVIISYGDFLNNCQIIRKNLKKENINLGIINARYIKPIDYDMYKKVLKKYKKIYIYEEVTKINSLGEYLVNIANDNHYQGDIKIFAIKDEFIPHGKKSDIIKLLQLDIDSITNKIKGEVNKNVNKRQISRK